MLNNHNYTNPKPIGSLHVAEIAHKAQVTPATVRYYSRIGLLSPGREPENGYRCFSSADLRRVVFIRQAQALGLTIGDIKVILKTVDHGETPYHQVRKLVKKRLVGIQEKLAALRATEVRISHAMETWQQMQDEAPDDGELCPLIERLDMIHTTSNVRTGETRCDFDLCDCADSTRNAA